LITIHRPLIKLVCSQQRAQYHLKILGSAELGPLTRMNEVPRPTARGLAFTLPDGRDGFVAGPVYVKPVFAWFIYCEQ
jgi:hypothetical protein